jgi:hypothetical protein
VISTGKRRPTRADAGPTQVDPFEKQRELGRFHLDAPQPAGRNHWQREAPLLESLVDDGVAAAGPEKDLRDVSATVK